jgi:uncharacterized protein YndB with AHSA1/START domain
MTRGFVATATITVDASADRVWEALTDPRLIARYMFGSTVESEWTAGSPITYSGEYEGKPYQDHGEILEVRAPELLRTTHFSPLGGAPDVPENYHTIAYALTRQGSATVLTLTQDMNSSEAEAEHSAANWQQMLTGLKRVVEEAD